MSRRVDFEQPALVGQPSALISRVNEPGMRDLKAMGAVINFEAFPDPEKNTASQLEKGRVYWTIRFTDVPPAENPSFQVEVTNQWITEVLDFGC
nr:phage tail sheath C-terminal domain-containing protein [Laribacter hongkongensis]